MRRQRTTARSAAAFKLKRARMYRRWALRMLRSTSTTGPEAFDLDRFYRLLTWARRQVESARYCRVVGYPSGDADLPAPDRWQALPYFSPALRAAADLIVDLDRWHLDRFGRLEHRDR